MQVFRVTQFAFSHSSSVVKDYELIVELHLMNVFKLSEANKECKLVRFAKDSLKIVGNLR